jgi:hypothetical protein
VNFHEGAFVMHHYSLYLIDSRGSKMGAAVETLDCESDAQALSEACKIFGRDPDVDSIEVWEADRRVVILGGRNRVAARR